MIRVHADAASGLLAIEDDGVGMARAELLEYLGTVARSGARPFADAAARAARAVSYTH